MLKVYPEVEENDNQSGFWSHSGLYPCLNAAPLPSLNLKLQMVLIPAIVNHLSYITMLQLMKDVTYFNIHSTLLCDYFLHPLALTEVLFILFLNRNTS